VVKRSEREKEENMAGMRDFLPEVLAKIAGFLEKVRFMRGWRWLKRRF